MPEFEVSYKNNKQTLKMFRKDNTILVYIILLAIVIGLIIASVIVFYTNHLNSNTIQAGVFIKDINVSGLTKEEATTLISNKLSEELNDHLILKYKNNDYYLALEQIEAKFNIEDSINFAYNIARSGDLISDIQDYITVLLSNINIDPILEYNEDELTRYLYYIESNLPDQLEQSSFYVEDDELIVTNGKNGAGIQTEELKKEILVALQDISFKNRSIDIPTYIKYPDAIDVESIHEEVYREPKDAYYTTNPYAVYSHVIGIDFDTEYLKREISENPDKEEYVVELSYLTPNITNNDLDKDAFPDRLSTFATKYPTSNTDRTTNLRLASNKIDGTIIMPGETFSYNKVVGKRTIAAGYKEAAIFSNGQVTQGLGGGICQISTTLYDAVVFADLEIVSRRNHMFVTSYVDGGKDATVVWGSTDFKFKNSRDYPIRIESSVSGGIARVSIYGLKRDNEYDISIETQTVKRTSSNIIIDAYKVYRQNGEVVKKEKLSRDTYKTQSK